MFERVELSVQNGKTSLHPGDVFRLAYRTRFEGEGLKKYENPPIIEDEMEINLFVEAISEYGKWTSELFPVHTGVVHLLGEDAKKIVMEKTVLKNEENGLELIIC